ncbi:TnsA-like heteromeric transposase endonuclease subunit [Nocardia yunnanensis]|uniref:TnsA-like heteromeric transposase endonuclease subunit n=2 Tax=Nocardia yunnanensis TaxID=2382165 RepID=A0A386ZPC8_9NOCA|nr:TnsA-like heteromeric transposase endonuclease subunit [Nocardia yunnanensis]
MSGRRFTEVEPWRTFRWRNGQRHYSGSYWAATEGRHVIYESRLELAHLLFADFDPNVNHIVAQPLQIQAVVDEHMRRHVPDFLLLAANGPILADVKPRRSLSDPRVEFTVAWTRELAEQLGWRYEVMSEPNPVRLDNVRFLAGYRRRWLFPPELLRRLESGEVDGAPLSRACGMLPDWPEPVVKAAILHLLWSQHFCADIDAALTGALVLSRGPK